MPSMDNDGAEDEKSSRSAAKNFVPLHIKTHQKGLLRDHDNKTQDGGTHNSLNNKMSSFFSLGKHDAQTVKFQQLAKDKDVFSQGMPSNTNQTYGGGLRRVFSRKLDWGSLQNLAKEWIKDPRNMVLLIWMICVAVSGAILFLVMTGMLNSALPKKSQRNAWFEVNNQILNALFTLMCLYQHPHRLYHLILLIRWRSEEDVSKLRKAYCKNASYKPHEWAHMLVVVLLLNLNCFAQYALCGLNVGYKRSERPAAGVAITLFVAIGAPAVAGVYSSISPLGKDYDMASDEESQLYKEPMSSSGSVRKILEPFERRFFFASKDDSKNIISNPEWSGGIFDFWEDISLAYLSLFCSCCVFGWNMERLGFGNMYVHIATFLLFCMAPFWIFTLAAINIDNEGLREAMGIIGVCLCVFGLLYGGFWRIQMRKRFNLPTSNFCFNKPAITDCALWLCCCWCSLAQEVRTGNLYDIVEDKFYKQTEAESSQRPMLPLHREGEHLGIRSSPSPNRFMKEYHSSTEQQSTVKQDSSSDVTLEPPVPSFIHY
uniref:uncharacterized protein LOC122588436 n=1 Tax=Erigeron canadensis TaxID=72917 RepID=UPI001CB89917|nr:uncharacterized protein LOC122588436 [Erigeron canadensis]